jgi:dienelactone hydrolase
MFGPGVAGDRSRTMALLTAFREDRVGLGRRASAGLSALLALPEVDGRAAAVGFCFGGMTALTLARQGADVAGVISMHGALATPTPATTVRARVLVCHGALDPHVPMSDVTAFIDEMTAAGADWQLTAYGNAMHGFTHTHAVPGAPDAYPGVAYHAQTDARSFTQATSFLAELFPSS